MLCILLAACVGAYPEPFPSPDAWIPNGYPDDAVYYYVRPPSIPVFPVSTQCVDNQTMFLTNTSLEKGDMIGTAEIYDNQTLLGNGLTKINESVAGNFPLAMDGNCSDDDDDDDVVEIMWRYDETDWPENTYLRHIVINGMEGYVVITPSTGKWEKWFWPLVGTLVPCAFIFAIIGCCETAIPGKIKNCCKKQSGDDSGLAQILL